MVTLAVREHREFRQIARHAQKRIARAEASPCELPQAGLNDDRRIALAGRFQAVCDRCGTVGIHRQDGELVLERATQGRAGLCGT